jgi:hypothetical protein
MAILKNGSSSEVVSAAEVSTANKVETLTNKTINNAITNYPTFKAPTETANIVAAAAGTATINIDVETSAIWYYTSNATADHTLNFRFNSGETLNSKLSVGEAATIVWLNTNGGTAFRPTTLQVDGTSIGTADIKWQGGGSPTAGNINSIDGYSFTVLKTAATPTYLVLGSQTQFA